MLASETLQQGCECWIVPACASLTLEVWGHAKALLANLLLSDVGEEIGWPAAAEDCAL